MKTITITAEFSASLALIAAQSKTPWLIINDDYAVGAYAGRAAARAAKVEQNLAGEVVKIDQVELKVLEIAKPVEKAIPENRANAGTGHPIEHHSTVERPCKLVWQLADNMPGARRKDVIAKAQELGVAFYTARTQYQLWTQVQKEMAERVAAQVAKSSKK